MMVKRYSLRGICKYRVYTYKMAARIISVSEATFRKWPKQGLKVITDKRPYLVRGADLIDFLTKRQAANKVCMAKGQFYCMRCNAPRDPLVGVVSYVPTSDLTGRLGALCAVCEGKVGRFCSASEWEQMNSPAQIVGNAKAQA